MKRLSYIFSILLLGCLTVFAQAPGTPERAGVARSGVEGGGELRFCLRAEPKTFNPLLVEDDASEAIRYLTGGVLVLKNP